MKIEIKKHDTGGYPLDSGNYPSSGFYLCEDEVLYYVNVDSFVVIFICPFSEISQFILKENKEEEKQSTSITEDTLLKAISIIAHNTKPKDLER